MTDNRNRNTVLINAAAGATQATLVTLVGYPFDLIKSRQQVGSYRNSIDCLKSTVRTEGLLGLYRGSMMPLFSHLFKRPIQYPIAEYMKHKLDPITTGYFHNYAIGAVNGLIGPFLGTPLQVVKVGVQTSDGADMKNSRKYIEHTYRKFGLRGFYRGFGPTMMKDTLFGASFLGHYYTLRDIIGTDAWWKNFTSGATAHCLTWYTLIPIDHIKTKVQRSETGLTVRQAITDSYRKGGVRIFWKGVLPACVRTIPVSGVAMVGYEMVRSRLMELA